MNPDRDSELRAVDRRNLLLVAYEFPPKGGTASQQVAKLVKGLAQRGWAVHVITVADPPTTLVDPALLDELSTLVQTTRVFSLEPTRLLQAARRISRAVRATPAAAPGPFAEGAVGVRRGYSSLPPWAIRAVQSLFLPDEKIGWVPWVVRAGLRLHRDQPFDLVLSTGPPFSAHIAARHLARRMRVPWVADLRDPIVGGYFFKAPSLLHRHWMRRFEQGVVTRADRVTVATEGMRLDLCRRHPDHHARISVLPNAFDRGQVARALAALAVRGARDPAEPVDPSRPFQGSSGGGQAEFTVAYVGSFQGSIRPDDFLAAAARLVSRDRAIAASLRVRFVGPLDQATLRAVEHQGMAEYVLMTGFVSHDQALIEMASADVLLLVLGPEPESALIQTSKLPEYLAVGKPVLALVPEGVAADIVRRSGAGDVVDPRDVGGAARALAALHSAWKEGALPHPDPAVVAEFDQDVLLEHLDEVLADTIWSREGKKSS